MTESASPPEDGVVQPEPATIDLTALGFHLYASQFLAAAQRVGQSEKFSPVPYYLDGRALELLLKAFLLAKGFPKAKLKSQLSHNLKRALKRANETGLAAVVVVEKDGRPKSRASPHRASRAVDRRARPGRHAGAPLDAPALSSTVVRTCQTQVAP